jgi:predicted CoA-binding protein
MASFTAKPVGNLLRAKSVAIIGASQKGAWPLGIYRNLKGAKFPCGVYLINPNYQELYGDKCYPNLAACPEVPDELLILIPTRAVLGVLEESVQLGTRSATIYTAGFGEGDDAKGKERAQQMRDLCDKSGMVICGPNCMGSYSVGEGLWTFPTVTPLLKKGPVGLIFQSGGSLGNWIKGATERGIGFSYAISSGNEVSLDLVDYLSFLVDDPATKVITLMVEGERKARRRGRARAIRAARDVFYKGEIARRIAEFHAREGGLLEARDLAEFQVDVAPALRASFRGYEVAACGFWCQGPVLLQMLNLIEPFDFTSLGHNSPRALHLLVEATKLAFADREAYYGDPKHVKVPGDALLSKAYAEVRRALIREDRAWPSMPAAGDPDAMAALRNGAVTAGAPCAAGSPGSLDTSYVAVVDAEGNGFSATPSDPNVDSPVVPGVGCVVSPRGSQGWLVPGHPSEVAPGKRPRLTPAPAMAFKDGRLFMPFGTPGGDVQQQAMLQVFLNITAYGMSPQQAVEAPRVATRSFPDSFWPHPDFPGRLDCERGIPAETRAALADLGHLVEERPDGDWRSGAVCAVVVGADGTLMAAADPRRGAHAIGW